jgi:hypothetical protein
MENKEKETRLPSNGQAHNSENSLTLEKIIIHSSFGDTVLYLKNNRRIDDMYGSTVCNYGDAKLLS